jgi:hypothetical protein
LPRNPYPTGPGHRCPSLGTPGDSDLGRFVDVDCAGSGHGPVRTGRRSPLRSWMADLPARPRPTQSGDRPAGHC